MNMKLKFSDQSKWDPKALEVAKSVADLLKEPFELIDKYRKEAKQIMQGFESSASKHSTEFHKMIDDNARLTELSNMITDLVQKNEPIIALMHNNRESTDIVVTFVHSWIHHKEKKKTTEKPQKDKVRY
jgi:phosphoribosylpyrophosphate synthetase